MADYFPYRIVTGKGDLTLIWRPGEGDAPDALLVDERGKLLAFEELAPLQEYCDRKGWELTWEGEGTLELRRVRRWVEHPELGPAAEGQLLDAWNFFEDLSRSVKAGPTLPGQGPIHDSAYEKLFGGAALDPTAGEDAWTEEETAAVRELLRAGLDLWEHAAHGPGSGTSTVVLMCGPPGSGKTTYALDLVRRLAVRNGEDGANAVTVDRPLFDRYLADFQTPEGEGEQVVVQA